MAADLVSEVVSSAALFVQGGSEHPSEAISAPGLTAADNATVFSIVAEESEVRFIIDEVLNGADFTVVGATDQVAGDISVNQGNPAASDIGVIRINARTLATDNGNRNRALRTFILKSGQDEYEFAEFEPQELTGLPQGVTLGEPFELQIVGELRIAGAVQELSFDASITLESAERLSGTAHTYAAPRRSWPHHPQRAFRLERFRRGQARDRLRGRGRCSGITLTRPPPLAERRPAHGRAGRGRGRNRRPG